MAIVQTDYLARWSYQLDPNDPCVIQRRPNKPHARWSDYLRYDDPHTARAKLLRLGRDNTVRVQHDAEADAQQYRMVLTEAVQHAIRRAPRRVKRIQEQTEAGNA